MTGQLCFAAWWPLTSRGRQIYIYQWASPIPPRPACDFTRAEASSERGTSGSSSSLTNSGVILPSGDRQRRRGKLPHRHEFNLTEACRQSGLWHKGRQKIACSQPDTLVIITREDEGQINALRGRKVNANSLLW